MEVPFLPADADIEIYTAAERTDLWEQARPLFEDVWPEYNLHGKHTASYFRELFPRFPHLQALMVEQSTGRVIGRARTIPFRWNGRIDSLPTGIDAVGLLAVESTEQPNTLSALAAEVASDRQERGLSRLLLQSMAAMARAAGLTSLVAPVRPSQKHLYPIVPIERYAAWRRPDGLPFDAWMRVHARLGATVLRPETDSLEIEAPVAEWETWTGMEFPEDGDYVFPEGLAPLQVTGGVGRYFEPNVWMLHELE